MSRLLKSYLFFILFEYEIFYYCDHPLINVFSSLGSSDSKKPEKRRKYIFSMFTILISFTFFSSFYFKVMLLLRHNNVPEYFSKFLATITTVRVSVNSNLVLGQIQCLTGIGRSFGYFF